MGNLCQTPTISTNMEQSLDWETPNILFRMTEVLSTHQKLLRDISQDSTNYEVSRYFRKQEPPGDDSEFNDPLFARTLESIYNDNYDKAFTSQQLAVVKKLIWVRPKDVLKPGFRLYDQIDWNDVQFGLLHNSYFLSSLSNLAMIPESFNKILLTKEISENGLYKVQFYINGKPKIVIVDEYLPAYTSKSWVFSRSSPGEFWVQIMEKAWAKVCGNYAATIGGLPSDALSSLIEAPCFTINVNRVGSEKVWNYITNALTNRFVISSNSLREDPEGSLAAQGLSVNEPYTVIDAKEHNGQRFVRLRNPWVGFEWKGDYSDSSNMWTEELKQYLDYKNDADGMFWMSYEDFCKFFHFTYISKFSPEFKYNFKKFRQDKTDNFVVSKITIESPQLVYIGLHQKQERFYKKVPKYTIQLARLIIAKFNPQAKVGENCYEFVGSDFSSHDKLYVSEFLQEGEYHIFTNIKWTYNQPCTYVVSTYAKNDVSISSVNRSDVPLDYLTQVLSSYVVKNHPEKERIEENILESRSLEDNNTGYAILNYQNENINNNYLLSFTNPSSECVNISGTISKLDNKNEIYLERNTKKTIIFESNVDHLKPFSISEKEIQLYSTVMNDETPNPLRNFIARNIEGFEKKRLNDDLLMMEYAYKNSYYFVIINENLSLNYRVKLNFNRISNLTFNVNEKVIDSRNFDYFELNGTPNQPPDFEFTVSLKSI